MADGDERGSCCGWAAVGDDGPDLAGDVQHGGADAADTACFEVGEGSAVVDKEDSAGAGVGVAPAGDVGGDGVGVVGVEQGRPTATVTYLPWASCPVNKPGCCSRTTGGEAALTGPGRPGQAAACRPVGYRRVLLVCAAVSETLARPASSARRTAAKSA